MQKMLDIHDLGIGLIGPDQHIRSPGYASLEGKELIFGDSARAVFRLHPGQSANQFWRDLNTQKVAANFPGVRHQADLVWNHLKHFDSFEIGNIDLVTVPSHYGKDQIALLSGILQSVGVGSSLLCKRSLLMASLYPEVEYQVDYQLHQLVVTKIERSNGELSCGEMTEYPGLGLLGCCDDLLKGIQTRFIDKTRFDPLHHAETEQQLFNQLTDGLFKRPWNRLDLKVEMGDQSNSIELSEKHLIDAAGEYLQKIQQVLPSGVFVADSIFSNLPLQLTEGNARYVLDEQFSKASISLLSEVNSDTGFAELTVLKATGSASTSTGGKDDSTDDVQVSETQTAEKLIVEVEEQPIQPNLDIQSVLAVATHLLAKGNAVRAEGLVVVNSGNRLSWSPQTSDEALGSFSLSDEGLLLSSAGQLRVNGKSAADAQILHPDDVISHDDIAGTLVAISVVDEVGL